MNDVGNKIDYTKQSKFLANQATCYTQNKNYFILNEFLEIIRSADELIDPILVTEDISHFDSGAIDIESSVSDHKGTYISLKTSANYNNAYNRQVWMYWQKYFQLYYSNDTVR